MGEWDGSTIFLCNQLTDEQARCTLAHEIVHLDRGMPIEGDEREEEVVESIAARRLVDSQAIGEVMARIVLNNLRQIADELVVDTTTLAAYLTDTSATDQVGQSTMRRALRRALHRSPTLAPNLSLVGGVGA